MEIRKVRPDPNAAGMRDDDLLSQEILKRRAIQEAQSNDYPVYDSTKEVASPSELMGDQLEALAPKKYTINPQLAEYLAQMRAGKDEAAAQERRQNSLFQAFDAVGQARANEWGSKYSPIGDTGDSAQKAAMAAEGAVDAANLKDIQGHIDRRGEIARALASKRGNNIKVERKQAGVDPITGQTLFIDTDLEGNKTLVDGLNNPAMNGVIPATSYNQQKRAENPTEKEDAIFASYNKALGFLDSIEKDKENIDTGKISSAVSSAREFFGQGDPEVVNFKAKVGQNLVDYIKSISGAAVTNEERSALTKLVPNISQNDQEFMASLQALKEKLLNYRQIEANALRSSGKIVSEDALKVSPWIRESSGQPGSTPQPQPTQQPSSEEEASIARQKRIAELKAKQGK